MLIDQIVWPDEIYGISGGPFITGSKRRNLSITLHTDSFKFLEPREKSAVNTLEDLLDHPDLEVIHDKSPDRASFDFEKRKAFSVPFSVTKDDSISYYEIEWRKDQKEPDDEDLLIMAHERAKQDLFITNSPKLLDRSNTDLGLNILSPTDGARLVGLYLRSRDQYVVFSREGMNRGVDHFGFYWVLVFNRLPITASYLGRWLQSNPDFGDESTYLAQAVLDRSSRALIARDLMGMEYFRGYRVSEGHKIAYHFDYLMLLLAGALDGIASMLKRAHSLNISGSAPQNLIQIW